MGGIVEEFVDAVSASPSGQGYIGPLGTLRPLSTHDQVLGGSDGQVFEGSTFPADPRYRLRVQEETLKVGEVLQAKGARGRFAVDFVEAGQRLSAIEINLRKGGTTHPMLSMAVITEGHYDAATGTFVSGQGSPKCYYATDNLHSDDYRECRSPTCSMQPSAVASCSTRSPSAAACSTCLCPVRVRQGRGDLHRRHSRRRDRGL